MLQTRLIGLCITAALCVTLVGVLNYFLTQDLKADIEKQNRFTTLIQNMMHADMMHDAIRADVYFAAYSSASSQYASINEAKIALKEHREGFEADLLAIQQEHLPQEINELVKQAQDALKVYAGGAEYIISQLASGTQDVEPLLEEFNGKFEAMEVSNETLSEKIVAWSVDEKDKSGAMLMLSYFLSGFVALITMFVAFYAKAFIFSPLKKLGISMRVLADGNKTLDITGLSRKDEVGDMAKAVQVFKENALEMERMEAETERNKLRSEEEKKAGMKRLADTFDERTASVIKALTSAAQKMQDTAAGMTNASERTSEISSAVAAAASEADANVQTVASATEELAASAREIAQQINMVAQMAGNASDEAENTSKEVKNLQDMAVSVGDVVSAIKGIAEQTNLLALNATIEAARAGDAGKGFAVVADEVKKLANETAAKTEEIDDRVTAIQNAITTSVKAMDKIIGNVKNIDGATTSVTAAVEEQNAATNEIGRNVSEASTGTQQVSQNILKVQENAYETGQASRTVLEAAAELSGLSEELRQQVAAFLAEIRNESPQQDVTGDIAEKLAIAAE